MNEIAKEYEETPATVLELATKYRKSAQQITDILSSELGSKKFSNLIQTKGATMAAKKTTKTAKTAKKEESKFKKGDRIQWFRTDGEPRMIGVINKVFEEVCWIQPAGTDGVGEIIKKVPLLQIEPYSDAPGPIETAIAELGGQQPEGDRDSLLDDSDNSEQPEFDLEKYVEAEAEADPEPKCQDWQFENGESAEESPAESEDDFGLFWLPIAAIAEHEDFQPRGKSWQTDNKGISNDVVDQYAEWLDFTEPPAIEVWSGQIGDQEGWWLISGHHRIRALLKAGRDKIQCFQKASNHEDAIYRAAVSNAGGGDRTRQIYKMSRDEWGEACKQFLRVADRLSEEAIREFLDEAVAITGKTKTWNKLNDSAIAAVFGISRSSVQNYQKQIELEKAAAEFPKGTRVILTHYEEIHLLNERKYRLGVVQDFSESAGLRVHFDYSRAKGGYFHPKDLRVVDDPPYEKPVKFNLGDKVWNLEKGVGIVVETTSEPTVSYLKTIDEENPLIFWENGRHTGNGMFNVDFEGPGKVPSIDERLSKSLEYIAVDLKDEPENSYLKKQAIEIHSYLSGLPVDEPTSTKQEEKGQRKELLGRSLPAGGGGSNGSELPDLSGTNGKHPEDPQTTTVGALERPAEATGLEQAREEARKSAALNRYNDLLFDLEVISDEGLKELIKLAKSELTRRHKPAQEGDPEKQELLAS